jgi:hypothetical protein
MGNLRKHLGPEKTSQLHLSALSIPGTHDSHAEFDKVSDSAVRVTGLSQTQDWGIKTQLEKGVRAFDLRLGYKLKMPHGLADLNDTLREVLKVMSDFFSSTSR